MVFDDAVDSSVLVLLDAMSPALMSLLPLSDSGRLVDAVSSSGTWLPMSAFVGGEGVQDAAGRMSAVDEASTS